MRRAYVGLSSPLAYDNGNLFSVSDQVPPKYRFHYNALPYPNPLLESPYGLLLLYDEVWFLSRSLCPKNMHDLPYVKFVLESEHAESIFYKYVDYNDPSVSDVIDQEYFDLSIHSLSDLTARLKDIPFEWEPQLRDSSEICMIAGMPAFGFSAKIETVLIDLVHLSHLDIPDLEFVTNRFTTPIVERFTKDTQQLSTTISNLAIIAESVLLDRIPNYLSKDGPYHPSIEEARADSFLADYRKWVTSHPRLQNENEIMEVVQAANASFKRLQNDVFNKYLARSTPYYTIGKGILYSIIDLLALGTGTAASVIENAIKGHKIAQVRWQGFLASQEYNKSKNR